MTNDNGVPDLASSAESLVERDYASSLEASSDIIRTIFGESVGPCWGDFFCSHNRIRGRLYASSLAVLFYSNLLGFERRICLRFSEISQLELCRTTSIQLTMQDGEVYIFRSFNNREQVLQILKGLKILEDRRRVNGRSSMQAANRSASGQLWVSSTDSTATPLVSNRRRSVSDSLIQNSQQDFGGGLMPFLEEQIDDDDVSTQLTEEEEPTETAWLKAKEWNLPDNATTGIESLSIPMSLEQFFTTFFADDALYSLDRYQRNKIGDRDIEITGWYQEDGALTRTMNFVHPIKSSYGMGPSEARTTRQQRLKRFGDLGISIENTTVVEGIPSADAFFVQDQWLVESTGENEVKLTTRFGTRFTKRALFRGLIEKNILKETTDWFIGYSEMIGEALQEKPIEEVVVESVIETKADTVVTGLLQHVLRSLDRSILLGGYFLAVISLALILQYLAMRDQIQQLRGDVSSLQRELVTLKQLLDAQQAVCQQGAVQQP